MSTLSAHDPRQDFSAILKQHRANHPAQRPYDIAQSLGVSELQVLIHSPEILSARGLDISFEDLFKRIPSFGKCMALTRNDSTVSEVKGYYGEPRFQGPMGLVHHDEIDLRMFTHTWGFALAVEQAKKGDDFLRSIQIFDKSGRAVHKVYPQDLSSEAWSEFLASVPERKISSEDIQPKTPMAASLLATPEIDREALRTDWLALQDTHDFHGLLRKHKADRLLAFELVGEDLAREVPTDALVKVIEAARDAQLKFMIFVGNPAMIQIRSGVAKDTRMLGTWFNILDPDFNLHTNMAKMKCAWLVNKPSRYGNVLSLEVFDEAGELALTLFGYRTDDKDVDPEWAKLVQKAIPHLPSSPSS